MDGLHQPYEPRNEGTEYGGGDARVPFDPVPDGYDGYITAPDPGQERRSVLDYDDLPDDATPEEVAATEEAAQQDEVPHEAGRVAVEHGVEPQAPTPEQPTDSVETATRERDDVSTVHSEVTESPDAEQSEDRKVHVGEIVRGGPEDSYGRTLATRKSVFVLADGEVGDRALLAVTRAAVDALEPRKEGSVILTANFNADKPSALIEEADGSYHVNSGHVVSSEGLLPTLGSEQLVKVIARAASTTLEGGRPETLAFRDILNSVRGALMRHKVEEAQQSGTPLQDPERSVNALELRDGVGLLRAMRGSDSYNEAPSLPDVGVRNAARGAMTGTRINANQTALERLGQFLEVALPREEEEQPGRHEAQPPVVHKGVPGGVVLLESHVGALDPDDAAAQSALLSETLVPTVATNTPYGRPELVIVEGAQNATPEALKMLAAQCARQEIPMVVVASELTQELVPMLRNSTAVIGARPSAETAMLSEAYGLTQRTEVQSATVSRAFNEGRGRAYQEGANWGEFPNTDPKGGSSSDSKNDSSGTVRSWTQSATVGEGRLYTQGDFDEGIGACDVAIINPDRTIEDVCDVYTGGAAELTFPIVREEVVDERTALDAHFAPNGQPAALGAAQPAAALPSSAGSRDRPPSQLVRPGALPERRLRPYQEVADVIMAFKATRLADSKNARATYALQYYCEHYPNPTEEGFWAWVDRINLTKRFSF